MQSAFRALVIASSIGLACAACGARTGIATGTHEDASTIEDANADVRADVAPDAPNRCQNSREVCLTTAEMIELWNHPPETGRHDAGPAPLDPNGCLPRAVTFDDCCNAAFEGPEVQGDACCYRFCVGACCDGTR